MRFCPNLLIMKKFAVIGNPIAHSRSPDIHAAFAASCGIELSYERVLAGLEEFKSCVDGLRMAGFSGANVTVPFKLDACAYVDELSDGARWAGAVNTLILSVDKTGGDNTDGVGLVRDITVNLNTALKGKNVLLLGAGGAARGVLRPLLLEQPASVMVKNRSLNKAQIWLDDVKKTADFAQVAGDCDLNVEAWDKDDLRDYDVVINATASGLDVVFVPPKGVSLSDNALAYDMMYGKQTAFLDWASHHQARTADGWGMLVEQAAKSFEIWHGVMPDTRPLIATCGQPQ